MDAVCDLCDAADVGIKTVFNPATGLFTITLYMGNNSQAVFSQEYENLTEQTYLESVSEYANTALIGGEGEGSDRTFVTIAQGSGENRREVFVDARDLQSADFPGNYIEALTFRGQSRLSELAPIYGFDAGVNPHGNLIYKTDFDVGSVVKVISKSWGVSMTARIAEVEETYDAEGLTLMLTFGKSELTLAQRMRSDMSDLRTSIFAAGGSGEIPAGSVSTDKLADNSVTAAKIAPGAVGTAEIADLSVTTVKIANLAVTTAKIADGAVTMAKINANALPTTAAVLGQRFLTNSNLEPGTVDLNDYMTFGEFTLYNLTATTNFPPGTWTGTGNSSVLTVQRYYSNTAIRQILTKRNAPAEIYTRTSSAVGTWTAWSKVIVVGDNGLINTANIADGAVTTAKMAQEANTTASYTSGSGVVLSNNAAFINKGVVCIGLQFQASSAIAAGGTICTITTVAFRPYTTVRTVASPISGSTTVAITISSAGVVAVATGATLPTGTYMISVTYARA